MCHWFTRYSQRQSLERYREWSGLLATSQAFYTQDEAMSRSQWFLTDHIQQMLHLMLYNPHISAATRLFLQCILQFNLKVRPDSCWHHRK